MGRENRAVDSSVLFAILNQEPGFDGWQACLCRAANEGEVCLCSVVLAELSVAFDSLDVLLADLRHMNIVVDSLSDETCFLAGRSFRRYRESGGPRSTMIPDFLIAAHGAVQAGRLAAIDRGYLRRWFRDLRLLTP
jgi:predicted nucleic acid-binding protein